MVITVAPELLTHLELCASRDAITPELWVERRIKALVLASLRREVASAIEVAEPKDLAEYDTAIKTVNTAIAERAPVVNAGISSPL